MLFNLACSRFYAIFYDLSSLGNFYSFSVDIIVLLFLVGSCTFCMYTLCTYYYYYYYFKYFYISIIIIIIKVADCFLNKMAIIVRRHIPWPVPKENGLTVLFGQSGQKTNI